MIGSATHEQPVVGVSRVHARRFVAHYHGSALVAGGMGRLDATLGSRRLGVMVRRDVLRPEADS